MENIQFTNELQIQLIDKSSFNISKLVEEASVIVCTGIYPSSIVTKSLFSK